MKISSLFGSSPPLVHSTPQQPSAVSPKLGVPMSDAAVLRKLGVDSATKGSEIIDVLGPTQLAEVQLAPVPGRIVYFNPELARLLGFDVPPNNELTPELEKQLIAALSYKVKSPDDPLTKDATGAMLTGYADKYGGFGLGYNKGAGRAAFLPKYNANIKGVGVTPLVSQQTGFDHKHGGAPMVEGFLEAIWGEVNTNLFAHGSTRILAVIDNGDHTKWKDGGQERRALIVRLGDQVRPGHLLDPTAPKDKLVQIFQRAAELNGTMFVQADGKPDLSASMEGIVDRHARTAAEQFRWRVMHGALSPSNMEIDGTQLDLGTIQTQPRTAPIKTLEHIDDPTWAFGSEHKARSNQLQIFWDTLVASLNKADRKLLTPTPKLDLSTRMDVSYQGALEVQMLSAAGLKEELAERLQKTNPKLVSDYTRLLVEMAALRNEGSINASRDVVRDVAVLDVFNLLRELPSQSSPTLAQAMEALRPIYRGGASVEKVAKQKAESMTKKLIELYGQVMTKAEAHIDGIYDDAAGMKRSIAARARFENEPIDRLYRGSLTDTLKGAIAKYEANGDRGVFKEVVDKTISASLRDVDGLLAQGTTKKIAGGIDIERRTIDGIDHAVRAYEDGRRRLMVEIPLGETGFALDSMPGRPQLTEQQASNLRYRFTTDDWKTTQEAPAAITKDEDGKRVVRFEIPMLRSEVGRLEGVFYAAASGDYWVKDGSSNFRGYAFAVPDAQELKRITG